MAALPFRRLFPLLALLAIFAWPQPAEAADFGWRRIELVAGRYALRYLPASLSQQLPSEPPPLIVFLHGSGSSPDAWQTILAPHAEHFGAVLLMPRAVSDIGFGIGDDLGNLEAAMTALAAEIPTDPRRRYLSGFSSGGAFALYLAHDSSGAGSSGDWAAVLGLGSPYRILTALGEPGYPVPTRLVYGNMDQNFTGGSFEAWRLMLLRLGVPVETSILPGVGHGGYPPSTFSDGFAFLLGKTRPEPPAGGPCAESDTVLCLHDGRFAVRVTWRDFLGQSGSGKVTPARSRESGLFYFFSPDNWELQVKVLDGCALNGRFWVFSAASTDVGYTLEITDLVAQTSVSYENPLGTPAVTITDIQAFETCP
jgi:predicted esterase